MKRFGFRLAWAVVSVFFFASILPVPAADSSPRERLLLDFGWKFHLGDDWGIGERLDKAGVNPGPAGAVFSDANWRVVNLPHDWVRELPFDSKADVNHGFKPVAGIFHSNSVGWYRRVFPLTEADRGRRLTLEFDGVYRDCRVFFNGFLVCHHESGYSSFRCDVTDLANCDGKNTIAVRVDASEFEGWFYEGAGIYRHVWLVKTTPLHVAADGTFVYSRFDHNVPQGPAAIHVQTQLQNEGDRPVRAEVAYEIFDPQGKLTAQFRSAGVRMRGWTNAEVSRKCFLSQPALWSPETPNLYKLVTTVRSGKMVVDRTETEFGIRTVAFDAQQGFLLNGRPYEIKGTCNHQDHAGVGAALPDGLQYFRVRRLKDMGDNSIRTSHNAPTPELLEACDRLGMLVMDENRLLGSDPLTLNYLKGQICRDRNHPCVFIWSLFNEEELQTTPVAGRVAATMQRLVHQLDPTRLCTAAVCVGDIFEGVNSVLDVRGWNYHIEGVDSYRAKHPAQPHIGTEQASTLSTRGIYTNDKTLGYMGALDVNAPDWGNTAEAWWTVFAARPWLSGGFVWTGFDYRGEPTPYQWPCINSHFGVMDTCGFPKDNFYYYQAWWSDRVVLHLASHWNWPGREGQDIPVWAYSNCEEVELFLNGRSLGRKSMPRNSHLQWTVQYAPGVLLAKGYKGGQVVAEQKVETVGAPTALKLTPDRASINADGEDVSIITVAVTAAAGQVVPVADNHVYFDLAGPGKIIGIGNGDPSCHEPDVYFANPIHHLVALRDWRFKRGASYPNPAEIAMDADDSQWNKADVNSDSGPLNPEETAVYRTTWQVNQATLATASAITVNFGMIDDDGWIYVNGHKAGESHNWAAPTSCSIMEFLHEGSNSIAVAVKNHDGAGGMNKGVSVEISDKPAKVQWQRSVFNGLAQIIVQADKQPGVMTLTAHADGLKTATLDITGAAAVSRPVAGSN
jgi:beta-galactosidase